MKVVGVVLARNEERFLRCAIMNVLPVCDEVLVFEHRSQDRTLVILEELAQKEPKVQLYRIADPSESHTALEKFAGEDVWIFAVDGDEIYDPARTQEFMDSLRAGAYADTFQIKGNVLHVEEWSGSQVAGYLGPPSRAMNKLYNFSLLQSWTGGFERLHGGEVSFRPDESITKRVEISDDFSFEDSPFRCLHLVFLRRSSWAGDGGVRPNIADRIFAGRVRRLWWELRGRLGFPVESPGKMKNYRLGDRVSVDAEPFCLMEERGYSHA